LNRVERNDDDASKHRKFNFALEETRKFVFFRENKLKIKLLIGRSWKLMRYMGEMERGLTASVGRRERFD
jgi:hypothetical protein